MRRISLKFALTLVLCCFAIYFIIRYKFTDIDNELSELSLINRDFEPPNSVQSTKVSNESTKIVLSFVVCKTRLNESLNLVKSVLLFTRAPINFVIFADDKRRLQLNDTLTRWQNITANQFQFELHEINFPEPASYWLNLFRVCSSQRLFFPQLLPHIDALIYVDTDTLFLGPVEELWGQFREFNTSHITALAEEDTNPNIAWYPRFAKHPFYGKLGLNSGVMLMNLTRMRKFGWMEYIAPVMHTWKDHIPWGDQDIINIIVSHRSHAVRVLACRFNYRLEQCAHGAACVGAIFLLHGSRGIFHKDDQPAFRACYDAIAEHQLGSDSPDSLLSKLDAYMSRGPPSPCGALKDDFLRLPTDTLRALYPALTPR